MFEVIFLLFSVLIGSLLGVLFVSNRNLLQFLLTFSGAYFLATAVLEIFPEVYEVHNHTIGLFILAGIFFQMIIETFSKGAEHGHVHIHGKSMFPLGIFLGLFLHSFFEGMPLLKQPNQNLLWAIFIHNIPVSMVLFVSVSKLTISKLKKVSFMTIFAISGPLGVIFGNTLLADYSQQALAFVAGIFIHIATVILFESNESHSFKIKKIATVLIGFITAYLFISVIH